MIAPILARRDALAFWIATALTGLLEFVQHSPGSGNGADLLEGAEKSGGFLMPLS
jgi:hypothetical protein